MLSNQQGALLLHAMFSSLCDLSRDYDKAQLLVTCVHTHTLISLDIQFGPILFGNKITKQGITGTS